jgi:hypothetical protein
MPGVKSQGSQGGEYLLPEIGPQLFFRPLLQFVVMVDPDTFRGKPREDVLLPGLELLSQEGFQLFPDQDELFGRGHPVGGGLEDTEAELP